MQVYLGETQLPVMCISKVVQVEWHDTKDITRYLGRISAQMQMGTLKFREIVRHVGGQAPL